MLEEYYGYEAESPRLAVVAPSEVEPSGATMGGDTITIEEHLDLVTAKQAFLSELTHTFQRFRHPGWQFEGQTTWFKMLLMVEIGEFSEDDLRRTLRNDVHRDEAAVPAADSLYDKGRVLVGALDVDIRARTDADIGAVLDRANDQRLAPDNRLARADQLRALYEVTGVDYTDFYRGFVDGSDFPEAAWSDGFSVSEPSPIQSFAAFEYPTVSATPDEPLASESWTLTLDVENVGGRSGTRTLRFEVEDVTVTSRDVDLGVGESTTVTFEHAFGDPGEREVRVPPVFENTVTVVPSVTVTAVTPPDGAVGTGRDATLTVEVTNRNDTPESVELVLKLDTYPYERLATRTVTVDGGATQEVALAYAFEDSGEYGLQANGVDAGTVTVSESTATRSSPQASTESMRTTAERSTATSSTEARGPGLGVVSTLAGLGSVVAYQLFGTGRDEE